MFYIPNEGHIVNVVAPVDLDDAAVTGDAFSMENYSHVDIIIQLGVTGAAATVTLEECTSAAGAGNTAIAFTYYAEATAGGDTLGAATAATDAGFATSTNDGIFYVISVDASQLSEGSPWLQLQITDPGAATFGSAVAVLSGARYASDQSATVIA